MTTDMREQVAQALYGNQAWAPSWEAASEGWRNRYRAQADRAIAVIGRDMTGKLAQAFFEVLCLEPTEQDFQTLHGILLDHLVEEYREKAA